MDSERLPSFHTGLGVQETFPYKELLRQEGCEMPNLGEGLRVRPGGRNSSCWEALQTPHLGCFSLSPPLVTKADLEPSGLKTLEHVAVTVSITHPRRGNLEIHLLCPSGMDSLVGTARSMDS